ncbi:MAG: ROK family transcriptional regulator [Granulosicoccus sp.]
MPNTRDLNRARVFEVIHLFEPISRAEVAQHVGLSSAAVSYIVAELLDLGFIEELGRRASVRGQPAIDLGVAANSAYTLGMHFNHERIRGVVVDLKGNIIRDTLHELPESPSPELVLDTLIGVGTELKRAVPDKTLLGAGLASVGPINLIEGCVTQTAFTRGWHNVSLRQPLADVLMLPVCMDNNATATAIGEYWYGVGRDYDSFLHISFFGNGLGGGLFLNRRVYRGSGLNAAEFGHMLIHAESASPSVQPFLENYVSGYALKRDLGNEILNEFPARLAAADPALLTWLESASSLLAKAIVSVDHLLDIDAIIVGGELPESLLTELVARVRDQLAELYMPGWSQPLNVRQSQNCSDAAVLGAATLPIYDAFALSAQTGATDNSLIKSNARRDMNMQ